MSEENNNQNEKQNQNKVTKAYNTVVLKLQTVLKQDKLKLPTTVEGNMMEELVADLFKEEREANYKELKEALKDLLRKHVKMEADIAELQKGLDQAKINKQKEFTAAANKVLGKIDGVDSLVTNYTKSLKSAIEVTEDVNTQEKN